MAMTRSQIKSKINALTREKNSYNATRNSYKNSLNLAKSLVTSLNSTNNSLTGAYDNMRRYYAVNGKTADNGKITKNKDNINQIIKRLNNTVIPSINNCIHDLDYKINSINRQIQQLNREYRLAEI